MTDTANGDDRTEDELRLPAYWAEHLPSRTVTVELDPEGPRRIRDFLTANDAALRSALARPEHAPIAAAALRHLDGDPDPEGAGYLAAFRSGEHRDADNPVLRPELDAWVLEHGLAFAVRAAIARLSVDAWAVYRQRRDGIHNKRITKSPLHQLSALREELHLGIADVRALLDAAAPADRAAALAAAVKGRNDPAERVIATLLFPGERAWAEEVCREYRDRTDGSIDELLWPTLDDAALLRTAGLAALESWHATPGVLAAMLRNLGTDALPFFAASLARGPIASDARLALLHAIGLIPGDDAMAYLVARLGEPHVFGATADAVDRFPRRALRVIAAHAATAPPEHRHRLAVLARHVPAGHRAALPDATRTAIETLIAPSATPIAEAADLPALLTAPPWTRKRGKVKPVVIEGLQAPAGAEVRWAEGEQEEWSQAPASYSPYWGEPRTGDWALAHDDRVLAIYLATAESEKAEPHLDHWLETLEARAHFEAPLLRIVARWGARVADRALIEPASDAAMQRLPGPILSTAAARLAASRLARLKSARDSAAAWFDRHGLDAVALLVPDALGAAAQPRRNAEAALHHLSSRHGAEAVATAAKPYGPEAVAAVASLFERDPLEPRAVKIPRPGPWADPELLPEVLLADRARALPPASVRHLTTVLALADPDRRYAGLDVVAEACDAASLARFSRALFQAWIAEGGPSKDGWALTQLAAFADDDTVRLLAPLVREWPGENQHKRAVSGLKVLGAIGSETALRAIQGIAEKVKFKALKQEANEQIERIAEGLGLTREQLADRLLPDFGLGADGSLLLDYGPRRFRVAFDERLKPQVADEDGKLRKSLPRPGAKDDPERAGAAYKRFSLLKKELRTVSADQVQRLETAMVTGRTWTKDEFERYTVRHPLARHLARRLVWSAETDAARTGFRVAEDLTYTDADDEAFDLPDTAVVRLDHPVHMGDRVVGWSDLFADYEILQPFDQLGRPVMAFTAEELETGRLARFEDAEVEVGRLLGLTKRGWHRARPEDGGVEPGLHLPLPGGGHITIALEPGIWVGMIAENPVQWLRGVCISGVEDYLWSAHATPKYAHPKDIDPVTASEALLALTRLTGKD